MTYNVFIRRSGLKELEALPKKVRLKAAAAIEGLASDPRPSGAVKLTGIELFRIRSGEIRVVYSIEDDRLIVIVVRVGHRREVRVNSSTGVNNGSHS